MERAPRSYPPPVIMGGAFLSHRLRAAPGMRVAEQAPGAREGPQAQGWQLEKLAGVRRSGKLEGLWEEHPQHLLADGHPLPPYNPGISFRLYRVNSGTFRITFSKRVVQRLG